VQAAISAGTLMKRGVFMANPLARGESVQSDSLIFGARRGRQSSLWLGRLLAVLSFVLRREAGLELGVADEALRIGAFVLVAPVAFALEFGGQVAVAQCANLFRHTVGIAPPGAVDMAVPGFGVVVVSFGVLVDGNRF